LEPENNRNDAEASWVPSLVPTLQRWNAEVTLQRHNQSNNNLLF
jgi:hypothetical protein